MSEYNEPSANPNLYERLAPEYRFVRIAGAILERIGEQSPNAPQTKLATWQDSEKRVQFKLQAKPERTPWGTKQTVYCLEHFIDELPNIRPIEKYTASTSGKTITKIGVFDAKNKPKHIAPDDHQNAIRQLLIILHDIAPQDSDKLLDEIFTTRYESLIGAYVLSDLAVGEGAEELTDFAVWQAVEDYTESIDTIKEIVLEDSKRFDSPAKQETIEEAVTTRRTRTNKNEYEPVNVQSATERVAKEIGKKWKYTILPEQ